MSYSNTELLLGGDWTPSSTGQVIEVFNPATGEVIGNVAHASRADFETAVRESQKGFDVWRGFSAFDRGRIMRDAADLLRARAPDIARHITLEQGKPLAEAVAEATAGADIIDWFAEEGRRQFGHVIPAREPNVQQLALKFPVGPVAAFAPWNFPINQSVRKIAPALAAGCSIIIKPSEETPRSSADLVQCFVDAGVPDGVITLLYGTP